jgi:uncharacterized repeat protein (TIGR03803 family)
MGQLSSWLPPANGQTEWSEVVIYNFCSLSDCADGTYPQDAPLVGSDGLLYGTASEGGQYGNRGTVFKLTPPPGAASAWSETVLYSFAGNDGEYPQAGLIADAEGVLYSTTLEGGSAGYGTIFALTPPANGTTSWSETVLHSFTGGADGSYPKTGLTAGARRRMHEAGGGLYGTASDGGANCDTDFVAQFSN